MQKLLRDIADIRAGYSFRETIPASENGNYRIIQIKDINYDGSISNEHLVKADIDFIKPEYLTEKGNVLFTSRGVNRRAAVIDENSANAVFVSQLYSLKIKTDGVEPAYLAWYIGQKPAQGYFEANASGSYIQNIRQDVLDRLPISLPPLDTQRKIVEMQRLSVREKEITEQILTKRRQVTEQLLSKLIKEELNF